MITIPAQLSACGRFKLIRHTGHVRNAAGEITQLGEVLEETPLTDNVFTNAGRAAMLGGSAVPLVAKIGTSGAAPTATDVNLGAERSTADLVSVATTRTNAVDGSGLIHWRTTYRFAFPIAGTGTVSYKQAAVWSAAFGYISASLIKTADGSPTAVTLDQDTEAVDLVWEFNEYIPAEKSGTVVVPAVKGGSVVSTTMHHWILRPANFTNVADTAKGWAAIDTAILPSSPVATGKLTAGSGTIGYLETAPTFTESFHPDTAGSFYGQWGFESTPAAGVSAAQFMLGHTEWQVSFDPPLPKTAKQLLKIALALTVTNRG